MNVQALIAAGIALIALGAPLRAQEPAPAPRVVVNVPEGRLHLYEGEVRVKSYPVSVGRAAHRTPLGSYVVRQAVWNPDWTPPASAWARAKKHAAPGPRNPMGRVKLPLVADYYVHGTVAENEPLLGTPASHGCIRMSNADVVDLARRLHAGADSASAARVERAAAEPLRTRRLALPRGVPVDIVYRVAEVSDGRLVLHPDVYGRVRDLHAEIRVALLSAGYPPSVVGDDAIATARRALRETGRVALDLPGAGRLTPVLAPASSGAALD
jgi:murein L,D-transpeptidase YcbB/YkuD